MNSTEENLKQIEGTLRPLLDTSAPREDYDPIAALESLASLRESFAALEKERDAARARGEKHYAESMEGHRAFAALFGAQVDGRDFADKLTIGRDWIATLTTERDQQQAVAARLYGECDELVQQISALEAAAKEHEQACPMLSARDSAILADLIENPPEPNERLRNAWRKYMQSDAAKDELAAEELVAAKERDARVARLEGALGHAVTNLEGIRDETDIPSTVVIRVARAALSPGLPIKESA